MALKYVRAGKIATIRPKAIPVELNWESLQKAYGRSVRDNLRWSAELAARSLGYFFLVSREASRKNWRKTFGRVLNATLFSQLEPKFR